MCLCVAERASVCVYVRVYVCARERVCGYEGPSIFASMFSAIGES